MVKVTAGTARGARGREYSIADRAALAAVIRKAIRERHGGNHSAAALAAGIPNSTLQRYVEERGAGIRPTNFLKLQLLVGPADAERLRSAVLAPAARGALVRYDKWIDMEIAGALGGRIRSQRLARLTTEEDFEAAAERDSTGAQARSREVESLLEALLRWFPDEWQPLEKRLVDRGHRRGRALPRMLSPHRNGLRPSPHRELLRAWRDDPQASPWRAQEPARVRSHDGTFRRATDGKPSHDTTVRPATSPV